MCVCVISSHTIRDVLDHSQLVILEIVCVRVMSSHIIYYSRVWINRVRLPIFLVDQLNREKNVFPLSPFGPENLIARDRFTRPVPRQSARSPHSGWF